MLKLIKSCNSASFPCSGFNTSHVKVNPLTAASDILLCSVSIHPMLKLIFPALPHRTDRTACFNTSHVKVNLYTGANYDEFQTSFNTSHVKVNLLVVVMQSHRKQNFKTSHVKVNPSVSCLYETAGYISKHPMLKLIQRISCIPYNTLYQIPQYLSTFLKFLPATAPFAKKIYKITAMPLFLRIHAILH